MATKYEKGRGEEYRAMREIRELGGYPIRSAGSHGYMDVIGFFKDCVWLIQIKSTDEEIPTALKELKPEIEKFKEFKNYPEAILLKEAFDYRRLVKELVFMKKFWIWFRRKPGRKAHWRKIDL